MILGIFVLFVLFLIIKRASQYLNVLREPALEDLSKKLPPPTLGLKTNVIGVWIPVSLMIFNILLLIFTALKIGN